MKYIFVKKIRKIGGSRIITIPSEIAKTLNSDIFYNITIENTEK